MNWIDILRYGGAALFLIGFGLGAYGYYSRGAKPPAGWRSVTAAVVLMFTNAWIRTDWLFAVWAVVACVLVVHGAWQYVAAARAAKPRT